MAIAIAPVSVSLGEPQRSYLTCFKILKLPGIIGLVMPLLQAFPIPGLKGGVGKSHLGAKLTGLASEAAKLILNMIGVSGASFASYLTSVITISLISLQMGDIDMYCRKTFLPGRSVKMIPLTMFGSTVEFAGQDSSSKQGQLEFYLDEFGYTRLFFEAAKDLTGDSLNAFQTQKMRDALVDLIGGKSPLGGATKALTNLGNKIGKNGPVANKSSTRWGYERPSQNGFRKVLDELTSPTFEFAIYSVSVDKRTITDGTLLRHVQIIGTQKISYDKGSSQSEPMGLTVDLSWDYQVNSAASVAYLLGQIGDVGIPGSFANMNIDWSREKSASIAGTDELPW